MFFGKDISKYDVGHQLKMVKFNNIDCIGILDKKETKSSIFNLFDEVELFFNEILNMVWLLKVLEVLKFQNILIKL